MCDYFYNHTKNWCDYADYTSNIQCDIQVKLFIWDLGRIKCGIADFGRGLAN